MKYLLELPKKVLKPILFILFFSVTFNGYSQSTNSAMDSVNRKINDLNDKFDRELKTSNDRYETLKEVTDRFFTMFNSFGTVGSILGGILIIITVWQTVKGQNDYNRERRFYEGRVMENYKLSETASIGEGLHLKQQLDFGEKMLAKSDELLKNQIENIGKLGDVIGLVHESFKLQIEKEKEQKQSQIEQQKTAIFISQFMNHYDSLFEKSKSGMLNFKRLSRMEWTHLSPQEQALVNRALTDFGAIPPFVLEEKENDIPHDLANLLQLLGVGAFYLNEIDLAADYLLGALKLFSKHDLKADEAYPYAFCNHFLGLIYKNWLRKDITLDVNLTEAENHLKSANDELIKIGKKQEFLTPLTLAEVYIYSNKLKEASGLLSQKIKELNEIEKVGGKLEDNQNALLQRSYLLEGNIKFLNKKINEAYESYEKAYKRNEKNHYAILSMAHVSEQPQRRELFESGLEAMEKSDALKKSEVTARAIALVWAIIASSELNNRLKEMSYREEFNKTQFDVRSAGNRIPLFFSPMTKELVAFGDLKKQLDGLALGT